jgi:hypothetical protein
MVDGVVFDNFLLTSDQSVAEQYAHLLWNPKFILESKAASPSPSPSPTTTPSSYKRIVDTIINATEKRPWLLTVYLTIILFPIMLIVVYCWSRESKSQITDDQIEKDTNEYADDDEEEEIETNQRYIKSKRSGKAVLENDTKPRRRTRKK